MVDYVHNKTHANPSPVATGSFTAAVLSISLLVTSHSAVYGKSKLGLSLGALAAGNRSSFGRTRRTTRRTVTVTARGPEMVEKTEDIGPLLEVTLKNEGQESAVVEVKVLFSRWKNNILERAQSHVRQEEIRSGLRVERDDGLVGSLTKSLFGKMNPRKRRKPRLLNTELVEIPPGTAGVVKFAGGVRLPERVGDGPHYLGFLLEPTAGTTLTGKARDRCAIIPLIVGLSPADLGIAELSGPMSIAAAAPYEFTVVVTNADYGPASSVEVELFLKPSRGAAIRLDSRTIKKMAGATCVAGRYKRKRRKTLTFTGRLPAELRSGRYQLEARVDGRDRYLESNETNNSLQRRFQVLPQGIEAPKKRGYHPYLDRRSYRKR